MNYSFKKLCIFFVIVIFLSVNLLYANISKSQAKDIVINQIAGENIDSINIFIESEIQSGYIYEVNPYKNISVSYSSYWMFFIDDNPIYNWGHNCRYVFINFFNGEYQIVYEKLPPIDFYYIWKKYLLELNLNHMKILLVNQQQ